MCLFAIGYMPIKLILSCFETGAEEPVPLYIHITCVSTLKLNYPPLIFFSSGPEEGQVARAKVLTEDLLLVVRQEHTKMQTVIHHQQMELHQAQAQYAAYSAMAVGIFRFVCLYLSHTSV